MCSCDEGYENKGSWNCYSRQVKQYVTYVIKTPFDLTTNITEKNEVVEVFDQRVSHSLVDKIIEATSNRPQLTFKSLNIFYVFINTTQSNTSRKKRAEATTNMPKTEVYSEVEYEYSCEFGPQCTKFAKNLDEDPPRDAIRENLLQLESGMFYKVNKVKGVPVEIEDTVDHFRSHFRIP